MLAAILYLLKLSYDKTHLFLFEIFFSIKNDKLSISTHHNFFFANFIIYYAHLKRLEKSRIFLTFIMFDCHTITKYIFIFCQNQHSEWEYKKKKEIPLNNIQAEYSYICLHCSSHLITIEEEEKKIHVFFPPPTLNIRFIGMCSFTTSDTLWSLNRRFFIENIPLIINIIFNT